MSKIALLNIWGGWNGWGEPGLFLQLRGHASYTATHGSRDRKTELLGFLPFKPGTGTASLLPHSGDQSKSQGHPRFTGKRSRLPLLMGGPVSAYRDGSS